MSDTPPLLETDPGLTRRAEFLSREAAEVYLLLDFLSGRADRSVGGSREEETLGTLSALRGAFERQGVPPASTALGGLPADARSAVEADLADPTRLVLRAMRIQYPLREDKPQFDDDATFLIRARDLLNRRAAPATGSTIAFTWLVFNERLKRRWLGRGTTQADDDLARKFRFAVDAFPYLQPAARTLVVFMRRVVNSLILLLLVTLVLSADAAWGKLVLDEIAGLRREFTEVQASIQRVEAVPVAVSAGAEAPPPVVHFCDRPRLLPRLRPADTADTGTPPPGIQQYASHAQYHLCDRLDDVNRRFDAAYENLHRWARVNDPANWFCRADPVPPSSGPGRDAGEATAATPTAPNCVPRGEQWASAHLSVVGNYLLPVLYGLLGAMAFVLRRFQDRMADSLLTLRDHRGGQIRLALGALTGACIGLFLSPSAAQAGGLNAVALSTSALAFLAGYGVEGVFRMLDALIGAVFRFSEGSTNPPPRASP